MAGQRLPPERLKQFKKAFAGSVSLEEVWDHIDYLEGEIAELLAWLDKEAPELAQRLDAWRSGAFF